MSLTCKLTSPELQQRKETILKSIKDQITEKNELDNGYRYQFPGTNEMLDELTGFIKSERACCNFFVFNLTISGDEEKIWLEITGPEGAKEFISAELGF